MPKISFVVPVCNTAQFLSATLDSILAQTYRNIEIICSNDCLTDSSSQMLDEYAKKDSRVKVVTAEKNGGVSCARNQGLEHVTGEYVWFFDSDNLLHPQAAEIMLRACEGNKADFAYTPVERVQEEAALADCVKPVACTVECMASPTDPYRLYGNDYGMQHILAKAELVRDNRFERGVTYGEDVLFVYRFLIKNPKGVYIHEPLVYYRQREPLAVQGQGGARIQRSVDRVVECLKPLLMLDMPSETRTVLTRWLKANNAGSLPQLESESSCYAVMASDDIRAKSTSGGVFTVLAEDVIAHGGCVAGAVYANDWSVKHELVETVEGIAAMRGSKYVRGVIDKNFLARLDEAVALGRTVLFTGLPCQVAAMRKRYGNRQNVIFLDIICHGAPDARLWRKRVEELSSGNRRITGINFRDKRNGWGGLTSTFAVNYDDGSEYAVDLYKDPYGVAFGIDLLLPEECTRCPFSCEKRVGDITIGDFWDLANSSLNDCKGLSCVVVNTLRGLELFERVRNRFYQALPYPVSYVKQPNFHMPSRPHPFSREFQKDILAGMPFDAAVAKYAEHPKSVAVLNFHWEQTNFGALLTSFALSRHLTDIGWQPQNIDYSPLDSDLAAMRENVGFESFRYRHLPRTRKITDGRSLWNYTKRFKTFIVGSDQVWSKKLTEGKEDAFYLSFVGPGRRLIAAAASFGMVPAAERDEEDLTARLRVFSAISVREMQDAQTVRNLVGKGECVPDPVFWVDRSVWDELADKAKRKTVGKVVVYSVNMSETVGILKFLEMSGLTTPKKPARMLSSSMSPEEWLSAIRAAKLVVTDSFHGACFSVLFHTPFICIQADENRSARHRTMLEGLGLSGHLFKDGESAFQAYSVGMNVDWAKVDEGIAQYRSRGRDFIESALATDDMASPEMAAAWTQLEDYRKEHPCLWTRGQSAMRSAMMADAKIWAQRCRFKEERDALRVRVEEQKAKEAALWAERSKFLEERDALRGRVEEQKAKETALWAERCKFLEERDALRGRVEEQKAKETALWAERSKFLEERDALRERVEEQKAKETALWAERCKFLEERDVLRERVEEQKAKETALWAERCKFLEERDALRGRVEEQKAKETALWAERCKFLEERDALRGRIEEQKAKETVLWAERCKFLEERDALRGRIEEQKAKEAALWAERSKFLEERDALRGRVEEQKAKETALWAERCKFLKERDALRGRVEEQKAKETALWAERCKFLEERDALRGRVEEQKAKETALWAERCKFLEERDALRGRAEEQKAKEASLWAERCKFMEERDALSGRVEEQRAKEAALWAERGKIMAQRDALRERNEAQKAKEAKLWAERGKFKDERDALLERIEAQKVKESKLWADRCKFLGERNELRMVVAEKDASLAADAGWIAELCDALMVAKKEMSALQESASYKLGRALTKPFRAIRDRFNQKTAIRNDISHKEHDKTGE